MGLRKLAKLSLKTAALPLKVAASPIGKPKVIVRRYKGKNFKDVDKQHQRDANSLAKKGYRQIGLDGTGGYLDFERTVTYQKD